AAICAGNLIDAMCANDFLDKIDIALQIPPVTRNLPCRSRPLAVAGFDLDRFKRSIRFAQTETGENFVDLLRFECQAENLIAFLVTQRNITRRQWDLSRAVDLLSRI